MSDLSLRNQAYDNDSDAGDDEREESSNDLFWQLFQPDKDKSNKTCDVANDRSKLPGTATEMIETLRNQGPVANMDVPAGWSMTKQQENLRGSSVYKQFSPEQDKDVKLSYFYNGASVGDTTAKSLVNILKEKPHELDPAEIASLRNVLRYKDNPAEFNKTSMRTEKLDNKMVLVVEGSYKADNVKMKAVLAPGSAACQSIHEIEYQAPEKKFAQHQNAAFKSLDSIKWKP